MPKMESLSSEGFQGQPVLRQPSCSAAGRHEKAAEERRGEPGVLDGVVVTSPLHACPHVPVFH